MNIFRESAQHLGNPVSVIHAAEVSTDEGASLQLDLQQITAQPNKQLPNCVSAVAMWNPKDHNSSLLLAPTKWPATRNINVRLSLELAHFPGQVQDINTQIHFQVRVHDNPDRMYLGLRNKIIFVVCLYLFP